MLKLVLITGPKKGRHVRVSDAEPVTIGRDKGRLRLHDSRCSKHHAEIVFDGGSWILRDAGSSNGTYLNKQKLHGLAELERGDVIQFGRIAMRVRQANASAMGDLAGTGEALSNETLDTPARSAPLVVPELSDEDPNDPDQTPSIVEQRFDPFAEPATPHEADDELDLDALFEEADRDEGFDSEEEDDDAPIEAAPELAMDAPLEIDIERALEDQADTAEADEASEQAVDLEPSDTEDDSHSSGDYSLDDESEAEGDILIESGIFDPVPGEAGWGPVSAEPEQDDPSDDLTSEVDTVEAVEVEDIVEEDALAEDALVEEAVVDEVEEIDPRYLPDFSAAVEPVVNDDPVADASEEIDEDEDIEDAIDEQVAQEEEEEEEEEEAVLADVMQSQSEPPRVDDEPELPAGGSADQVLIEDDLPDAGKSLGTTHVLPSETLAAAAGGDRSSALADDSFYAQEDDEDAIGLAKEEPTQSVFDRSTTDAAPSPTNDASYTNTHDDLIRIGEDDEPKPAKAEADTDTDASSAARAAIEAGDVLPMPEEEPDAPAEPANAETEQDTWEPNTPIAEPEPQAVAEPESDPVAQSQSLWEAADTEPTTEIESEVEHELDPEVEVAAEDQSETEVESEVESETEVEATHAPIAQDHTEPADAVADSDALADEGEIDDPAEALREAALAQAEDENEATDETLATSADDIDTDTQASDDAADARAALAHLDFESTRDDEEYASDLIDELRDEEVLGEDETQAPSDTIETDSELPILDDAAEVDALRAALAQLNDEFDDEEEEEEEEEEEDTHGLAAVLAGLDDADNADTDAIIDADDALFENDDAETDLEQIDDIDTTAQREQDPRATDDDAPRPASFDPNAGSASAVGRELDSDSESEHAAVIDAAVVESTGVFEDEETTPFIQPSQGENPTTTLPPSEPRPSYRSAGIRPRRTRFPLKPVGIAAVILLVLGAGAGLYFGILTPRNIAGKPDKPNIAPSNPSTNPTSPGLNPTTDLNPDIGSTPGTMPPTDLPGNDRNTAPQNPTRISSTAGIAQPPDPFANGPRVLGSDALAGRTTDDRRVSRPIEPGATDDPPINEPGDNNPDTTPLPPFILPGNTPNTLPPNTIVPDNGTPTATDNTPDTLPQPTDPIAPIDGDRLVFMVDCSGSLVDTLPQMLHWLHDAIETLQPGEQFTIIFFKKDQAIEPAPSGLKPLTRAYLEDLDAQWLDANALPIIPSGRSDPAAAFELALSYNPSDIYLLSDESFAQRAGDTTTEQAVQFVVQFLGETDIQLHGVQFFYESESSTLQLLAEQFNGSYEFVRETRHPDQDPIDLLEELENRNP